MMDIPTVLEALGLATLNWGPKAHSRATYDEFVDKWPKNNPPPPTKTVMEAKWAELQAATPPKTAGEYAAAFSALSTNKKNEVLAAIVGEYLAAAPQLARKLGL